MERGSELMRAAFASEIIAMASEDQEARQKGDGTKAVEIDKQNTEKLKSIIEQIGWPTKSKVGAEAAHAAWLIAQHANLDLEFQERCLALMKAKEPEEVAAEDLAYLEDRVLVAQGKPQIYGTQWITTKEGAESLAPIESMEQAEELRKNIGMRSLAEELADTNDEWK